MLLKRYVSSGKSFIESSETLLRGRIRYFTDDPTIIYDDILTAGRKHTRCSCCGEPVVIARESYVLTDPDKAYLDGWTK